MAKYKFNEEQYFVIEDYDRAKTFSSFLPGISGLYGIPMWSFYVNRGQGMVSFGIKDKNHAITEFFPANQAYQRVSLNGFRTFVKLKKSDEETIFEPFSSFAKKSSVSRNMYIKANELKIEETNHEHGIKTVVTYFTLPNENFAALVRKVELQNLASEEREMEVLDGLPAIIPYGIDDAAYKAVGNTLKSWMDVFNLEKSIPYYKVRSSTADSAEVEEVTKGHFYLSFAESGKLLTPIVDADLIFGANTSLSFPDQFEGQSIQEISDTEPTTANKVPCGFSGVAKIIAPGETLTIHTLIGHVNDAAIINEKAAEIVSSNYIDHKYEEAQRIAEDISQQAFSKTGNALFDAYSRQSYLDNVLRGGYPILLETENEPFVYYVYSRKHGDLERDYNFFSLADEFFSQGNGNFRDVNQNRRNDIFFHPETGEYNIKLFMNLIQADGYNPLVVKGASFSLNDSSEMSWLTPFFTEQSDIDYMQKKLHGSYTPGNILQTIVDRKMSLVTELDDFLKAVLTRSKQNIEAEFGEGFWMDHWTYNLDLIENFLRVFPDKKKHLLFEDASYKFFKSPVFVKPRSQKYVQSDGEIRQYGAILEEGHSTETDWQKDQQGEEYTTTLMSKLVTLALVKFTTLDPYGMGIEMEGNKPGWNDSMNGLPGLFGSAMSETLELKRLLAFIIKSAGELDQTFKLPAEVVSLLNKTVQYLDEFNNHKIDDFGLWDAVSSAREEYREAVRRTFDGQETSIKTSEIAEKLSSFLNKVNEGISKAAAIGDGLIPTYFYFTASEWDQTDQVNEKGLPLVRVNSFALHTLPHFLEGPARALKSASLEEARETYNKVKSSDIFDAKLRMYKTSSSLEQETFEIGRSRAFTPGWLERESIFMHMEFKYLLSVLKSGLYNEFFEDLKHALPPFMNPEVYGRSVLENSSFIASSVNPDETVHGQGFVARLSGTTAEFLSIWQIMMMGKEPFVMKDGKLSLSLQPILPAWLFSENGEIQFSLMGKTLVTYHNPKLLDTFGENSVKTARYVLFGAEETVEIAGAELEEQHAELVRDGKISRMDIYLD